MLSNARPSKLQQKKESLFFFMTKCNTLLVAFFCSKVPAFLNVTDIAGLVKGASEGQGLGNAFLSHIKACDAMFHLCRKYFFFIFYTIISYSTR